jgi:hypothetical protein
MIEADPTIGLLSLWVYDGLQIVTRAGKDKLTEWQRLPVISGGQTPIVSGTSWPGDNPRLA